MTLESLTESQAKSADAPLGIGFVGIVVPCSPSAPQPVREKKIRPTTTNQLRPITNPVFRRRQCIKETDLRTSLIVKMIARMFVHLRGCPLSGVIIPRALLLAMASFGKSLTLSAMRADAKNQAYSVEYGELLSIRERGAVGLCRTGTYVRWPILLFFQEQHPIGKARSVIPGWYEAMRAGVI